MASRTGGAAACSRAETGVCGKNTPPNAGRPSYVFCLGGVPVFLTRLARISPEFGGISQEESFGGRPPGKNVNMFVLGPF